MHDALKFAALRGIRTLIQGLSGVAGAFPIVYTLADAKIAGVVALWSTLGAGIGGVAAFLQNLAERLEKLEDVIETT